MRDIFDIIENRKSHHIRIEGEVSEYSFAYDLETTQEFINELVDMILENPDHVETIKFYVKENNSSNVISNYGMYADAYEEYESIEFDIDVYVDNFLYNKLEHLEDFIDYYTKGSVVYTLTRAIDGLTIDEQEEYLSRRIRNYESVSVGIDWGEVIQPNWSSVDELFNNSSRPVLTYDWDRGEDWQIGSHAHDADGDAVYAAEFRPTDMTNMFRNATINLSPARGDE